jgi:hypothetical protein
MPAIRKVIFSSLLQYIISTVTTYCLGNSNPVAVWITMIQLCQIKPPGKLESTLLGLKMHYIYHLQDMDVTNQLQLGGAFSPALRGLTPTALVPARILVPGPVIPGPSFVRPVHTRPSAMANDPNNYRT